jgi:histidine triad (HIT) family protein
MQYDPNNVFARILRGELPCHRVFENEHSLAFVDIMPQTPGHTLVLPRFSAVTLLDLPAEVAAALIVSVQTVAKAVQKATNADGFLISQFNGEVAGQTVPHVHFHILPRFEGMRLKSHAREKESEAALIAMAQRIRDALNTPPDPINR